MSRLVVLITGVILLSCGVSKNALADTSIQYVLAQPATGPIGFVVTKIEYRSDLTRIYGRLKGRPHTSGRIDGMTLSVPSGESFLWTDIDGIDAERYFQWEDTPYIDVEIDFPAMNPQDRMIITLTGPKGESVWNIKRKAK